MDRNPDISDVGALFKADYEERTVAIVAKI